MASAPYTIRAEVILRDDLVRLFLSSIPCRGNTTPCLKLSAGCLQMMADSCRDVVSLYPEAMKACVDVLTQPQTIYELVELDSRVSRSHDLCRCDMSDITVRALHSKAPPLDATCQVRDLLRRFSEYMYQCLCRLQSSNPASFICKRSKEPIFMERSTGWPQTAADVIPHGVHESARALVILAMIFNDICFFVPLYAIATAIPDRALFTRSAITTPGLFKCIMRLTEKVIESLDAPSDSAAARSSALDDLSLLGAVLGLTYYIDMAAHHIIVASLGNDLEPFLQLCGRVISLFPSLISDDTPLREKDGHIPQSDFGYRISAAHLCGILGLLHDDAPYHPAIIATAHSRGTTNFPDAFHALYNIIRAVVVADKCGMAGCETSSTEGGVKTRKLSVCARCQLVPYCSRACQRQAWKYTAGAHRSMCFSLAVLTERVMQNGKLLAEHPERFGVRCRAAGLDSETCWDMYRNLEAIYGRPM